MPSRRLLNVLILLAALIPQTSLFAKDISSIRRTRYGWARGGISFKMGSLRSEVGRASGELSHKVTISKRFQYAKTEVTQLQWFEVMGDNPSYFKERKYCEDTYEERENEQGRSVSLCPNHPVETVSWYAVHRFIDKLNELDARYEYRLPTEAEWEYLARGKNEGAFSFGDILEALDEYGWHYGNSYDDNSKQRQTHEVASLKANAFGVYDAHGNVHEWVEDIYGPYPDVSVKDPKGPASGDRRVFRGGSWYSPAIWCRSAMRYAYGPSYKENHLGFRLTRSGY